MSDDAEALPAVRFLREIRRALPALLPRWFSPDIFAEGMRTDLADAGIPASEALPAAQAAVTGGAMGFADRAHPGRAGT
jgi:hypothetical protein